MLQPVHNALKKCRYRKAVMVVEKDEYGENDNGDNDEFFKHISQLNEPTKFTF